MSAKNKKRQSQNQQPTAREPIIKLSTQPEAEIVAGENDFVADRMNADTTAHTIALDDASSNESAKRETERAESNTGKYAFLVAAGILLSRIIGLVRLRVFAYYFGNLPVKGMFDAAFRIPNFLQNVFGEGALSASFIPVYAKLLAQDEEEATRVAGAVFSILALLTSVIVLIGIITTPYLIDIIAPGFQGESRAFTLHLTRILFPGAGLLVLSAWCLGVLNSHKRFFLSYTAPIVWNFTMIFALIGFGERVGKFPLAEVAAWASVIGSFLQFAVQLPTVLRLLKRIHFALDFVNAHVRTTLRNFVPVFFSRGVVQISGYIDVLLASYIGEIAVSALNYAQSLYMLPVSLFGMSVSAAELPEMSSVLGASEEVAAKLRRRLDNGLQRIAFYIVPSAMGFIAFGDVMAGVLFQTGQFKHDDALYVWGIIAGSSIGLLASTLGRLYSSTFYALHDTRTPLRFAMLRVALTLGLGYLCVRALPPVFGLSNLYPAPLPVLLGLDVKWGVAGLTASAGLAGWVEFALLRRALNKRIGRTGLAASYVIKLWTSAALAAVFGWTIKLALSFFSNAFNEHHPFITGLLVLIPFGLIYFAVAALFRINEGRTIFQRAQRILHRFARTRTK
jgi:putative peptidoglycan lipid II flippase